MSHNISKVGTALQNRLESGWTGNLRVKVHTSHSEKPMVEELTVEQVQRFSWFKWIHLLELETPVLVGSADLSSIFRAPRIFLDGSARLPRGSMTPSTYEEYNQKKVKRRRV